jgi:signal transduction histidine kinase
MEIALKSALKGLRLIATGLRLPELDDLTPAQVVEKAVKDYERKTGREAALFNDHVSDSAPLSTKITLYRIVQEALINGFRHAGAVDQTVKLWEREKHLNIIVSDAGEGFNQKTDPKLSNLGLAGLRERVELLGGIFIVESKLGKGTKIQASFPLTEYAKDG